MKTHVETVRDDACDSFGDFLITRCGINGNHRPQGMTNQQKTTLPESLDQRDQILVLPCPQTDPDA